MLKDEFNEWPREYAFFKAEGRSLDAVQRAQAAENQLRTVLEKLLETYKAGSVSFDLEKETFRFLFRDSMGPPPAGWVEVDRADPSGINPFSGWYPPKGHDDFKYLTTLTGISKDLGLTSTLEHQFDITVSKREFPAHATPDRIFAIESFDRQPPPASHPALNRLPASRKWGEPFIAEDPMTYRFLDGACYVRVPCDGKGVVLFTPPGSTPVDIAEIHKAEHNERIERDSNTRRTMPFLI